MKFREVLTVAHKLDESLERTSDVTSGENVEFSQLLLSGDVLEGLRRTGFKRPSPIQLKAIPVAKLGLDLVVQAKSGTGKTCVFAVLALETVFPVNPAPQVLILAPTREIANQIYESIYAIGAVLRTQGLRVRLFIGGTNIVDDYNRLKANCQIVVGTPGRVCQLIQKNALSLDTIRLFVLDEADKLMEESYQQNVNWIFSQLPESKQVTVFSATYPSELDQFLARYMRSPTMVRLDSDNVQLLGIKQYLTICPYIKYEKDVKQMIISAKVDRLCSILQRLSFSQCLIFCGYQDRCEKVCEMLKSRNWEVQFISGTLDQIQRTKVMNELKKFRCRLLVSTDLTARGIDAQNVNLIVNFDVPNDLETYFHRIGRAGRFGGYGAAISICTAGADDKRFYAIGSTGQLQVKCLGTDLFDSSLSFPPDLCSNEKFHSSQPSVDLDSLYEKSMKRKFEQNSKGTSNGEVVFRKRIVKQHPKTFIQPVPNENRLNPESFDMEFELLPNEVRLKEARSYGKFEMLALRPEEFKKDENSKLDLFAPMTLFDFDADIHYGNEDQNGSCYSDSESHVYSKEQMLAIRDQSVVFPHPNVYSREKMVEIGRMVEMANLQSEVIPEIQVESCMKEEVIEPEETNTQPRFVYNRRILLKIKKRLSRPKWHAIASSKWDLSQEPFISELSFPPVPAPRKFTYSRKLMIKFQLNIRTHLQGKKFLQYAQSKWDLSEPPFVADPTMRIPFAQQARARKFAEKKLKNLEEKVPHVDINKVIVEPNSTLPTSVNFGIMDTFEEDIKDFLKNRQNNSNKRPGPFVSERSSNAIWQQKVENAATFLLNSEKELENAIKHDLSPLESPVPGRQHIAYTREAMLQIWKEYTRHDIDPSILSWYTCAVKDKLYVPRLFKVDCWSEERQQPQIGISVEVEDQASQCELEETSIVDVSCQTEYASTDVLCQTESQESETGQISCKHEQYEKELEHYYYQMSEWYKMAAQNCQISNYIGLMLSDHNAP